MPRAVFLDRDGTLIEDAHYLKDPNKIRIINRTEEALVKMKEAGYLLFMHTNQSGIARGYYGWDDVHACNQRMLELLKLKNDFWDGICVAHESPDEKEAGYRKPSAKYQLEMISKYGLTPSSSWMVGDKWIDAETGLKAKLNGALVKTGKVIGQEVEKLAREKNVPICENLFSFTNTYLINT